MWSDGAARPTLPRPEALLRAAVTGLLLGLAFSGAAYAWAGFDLLDHVHLLPGCAFRGITGIPCPGCGMTRALLLLSQLRVGEALLAHPLAPLVLAAIAVWRAQPRGWSPAVPAALGRAALCASLGIWVWRLATGAAI